MYDSQSGNQTFMFGRVFEGLHIAAVCRWLSAVAFTISLPIALQAQVGMYSVDPSAGSPSGETASVSLPTHIPTLAPPQQITPLEMGDRLEDSQHYQAAIQAYAQIANPSAAVWNKMGAAYQMMYNMKDAMRCYKSSLKLEPTNATVLNNLAAAEELLGDYSSAERDYRKALKLKPNQAHALKNLGTNLLMQGEYNKSAEAYRQALAIDPHIFDSHSSNRVEEPEGKLAGVASYIKAESCSRAGLTECALSYLQRAFNEGSATVKKVIADADFSNLRGSPALARLLAQEQ
jgi:tetratricopeptide (TPR) repeat protein